MFSCVEVIASTICFGAHKMHIISFFSSLKTYFKNGSHWWFETQEKQKINLKAVKNIFWLNCNTPWCQTSSY